MTSYPPDALALFPRYTAASYLLEFGSPAPYDPKRLPKYWLDPSVSPTGTSTKTYTVAGSLALTQMSLPESEAATVNIPPVAATYTAYVPAPTAATRNGQPISPRLLSLESEADAIARAAGGSNVAIEAAQGTTDDYATDPRRMWGFDLSGQHYNAGQLLAAQRARGVDANGNPAPGTWDTSSGLLSWVFAPISTAADNRAPVAMPLRALHSNEAVTMGIGGIQITQSDPATTTGAVSSCPHCGTPLTVTLAVKG